MPQLIIVAHAPLASALAAVALHVYGDKAAQVRAVDVGGEDSPDAVAARLGALITERPSVETLLLADVFGATPCNGAMRVADGVRVRLVAGVNVPMLWRALCYSDEPLDRLVSRVVEGAGLGILSLSSPRSQNQQPRECPHDPVDPHHQQ